MSVDALPRVPEHEAMKWWEGGAPSLLVEVQLKLINITGSQCNVL